MKMCKSIMLYDKIYQYLWVKSETSNPLSVLIPDTVILIRSMPIYWYFTNNETRHIKKKLRKNATKENIQETWLNLSWKLWSSRISSKFHVQIAQIKFSSENLDLNYTPDRLKIRCQIQIVYFDEKGFEILMNKNLELPFGIFFLLVILLLQINPQFMLINHLFVPRQKFRFQKDLI